MQKKIQDLSQGAFPLSDSDLVRQIEEAVRMRVGEENSIPLSVEPVNNVVTKAQDLVELSTKSQVLHNRWSLSSKCAL